METYTPHIPALSRIVGQSNVQAFFDHVGSVGKIGQSYLFVGPRDAGELDAALALGQMLVCKNGGCGTCDECVRVIHTEDAREVYAHPDVTVLTPQGVDGYLVGQIRDLIADIPLAPIRAKNKLYIICDADKLGTSASNALLKSIEEPPVGVHFVLIAETLSQVLPTIESRCQTVVFSSINEADALQIVQTAAGVDATLAKIALSLGNTPKGALVWLGDTKRISLRQTTLAALFDALKGDVVDIHLAVDRIAKEAKGTKEEREARLKDFKESEKEFSDFISTQKIAKEREQAFKRQEDSAARLCMMEVLTICASLARDVLLIATGQREAAVNTDVPNLLQLLSSFATADGAVRMLEATFEARRSVRMGTDFGLTLEVMLFHIREALGCPPYYR